MLAIGNKALRHSDFDLEPTMTLVLHLAVSKLWTLKTSLTRKKMSLATVHVHAAVQWERYNCLVPRLDLT